MNLFGFIKKKQVQELISTLIWAKCVGPDIPDDDIRDLKNGAQYIPSDVTIARLNKQRVVYNQKANTWRMPDGTDVS